MDPVTKVSIPSARGPLFRLDGAGCSDVIDIDPKTESTSVSTIVGWAPVTGIERESGP